MDVYIVKNYDYGGGTLGAVFSSIETAEKQAHILLDIDKMFNDVTNIYRIIKVKLDDASTLDTVKIIRGQSD